MLLGSHLHPGDIFLAHGPEDIMREIFGDVIEEVPMKLADLSAPKAAHPIPQSLVNLIGSIYWSGLLPT
jgi:hypothetical protein